jgi:uncharacterized membrane protein YhaH (DUF805 family)
MRKEAREILKTALAAHGEHLFSDSGVCFGLLKDYGGNDHPEVKLLADAVDQDFPRRLLDHGSVSTELIERFAREFAERRFYDRDLCRWAVESWAVVLGLQREEVQSVPAIPHSVSTGYSGPTYAEPKFDQPVAGISRPRDDVQVVPAISNSVLTGYQQPAYVATSQTFPGIGRLAYAGTASGISIVSGVLQVAARNNSGLTGFFLVVTIVVNVIVVAQRLKNIGRNPWLCLLSAIPIVSLFICIPCLYAPPDYANTKQLDHAGRVVIWILWSLAGLAVLFVLIAFAISASRSGS